VGDELGIHQQRHDDQELDVDLDVLEERHRDVATEQSSAGGRQHQQGQPGQERDHDDPPTLHGERVVGQARAAQQLVEGSAENQRKVRAVARGLLRARPGFRRERFDAHGDPGSST
jgi:hypothetical protein